MLGRWQKILFWVVLAFGLGDLVFAVVIDLSMAANRKAFAENNERQTFISQTVVIARVRDELVRRLASASVTATDPKLRDLLAANGITYTVTPNAGGEANGAAPRANAKQ